MAKTRSKKRMPRTRARKPRHGDREQNEAPLSNSVLNPVMPQTRGRAGQTTANQLSPEQVGMLGQTSGNSHVLSILPTIQMKKGKTKPVSTPVGKERKPNKDGSVTLKINGNTVNILPDGTTNDKKMANRAETSINIAPYEFPQAKTKGGKVVEITGENTLNHTFTIRTIYGPNVTAQSKSGYGRGTTKADIAAGNTSLGFHEGHHGRDFINTLQSQPLPKFTGKVGMSVKAYKKAMTTYAAAIKEYMCQMDNVSEKETDCVGAKADFCIEKSTEE